MVGGPLVPPRRILKYPPSAQLGHRLHRLHNDKTDTIPTVNASSQTPHKDQFVTLLVIAACIPLAAAVSSVAGLIAYFVVWGIGSIISGILGPILESGGLRAISAFIADGSTFLGGMACVCVTGVAIGMCFQKAATKRKIERPGCLVFPVLLAAGIASASLVMFKLRVSPPSTPRSTIEMAFAIGFVWLISGFGAGVMVYTKEFTLVLPDDWCRVSDKSPCTYRRRSDGSGNLEFTILEPTIKKATTGEEAKDLLQTFLEDTGKDMADGLGQRLFLSHGDSACGPMAFVRYKSDKRGLSQIWLISASKENVLASYADASADVQERDIEEIHQALIAATSQYQSDYLPDDVHQPYAR